MSYYLKDSTDGLALGILISIGTFFIGLFLGAIIQNYDVRAEAIKHNAAEYNSKTGEFQWKKEELTELTEFSNL